MLHRLCGPPVNSFEFQPCGRTPQVGHLSLSLGRAAPRGRTASDHRLRRGLPGYLIPFATHAFVPQRQSPAGGLPSQSVFYVISKHFTATPHVPATSRTFKADSIKGSSTVEPPDFTPDSSARLRTL